MLIVHGLVDSRLRINVLLVSMCVSENRAWSTQCIEDRQERLQQVAMHKEMTREC
jgi:hypothetical protein